MLDWLILQGDARQIPLRDESVHCVVTSPRMPNGQFVKGTHWRPRKPHWDKAWLEREYLELGKSSSEIAVVVGCKENNIHFWLKKHGILRRTVSEARAVKHWGPSGINNPMFGKNGPENPNYKDGSSPERQRLYAASIGRQFFVKIYNRDGYGCRRCGSLSTGPRSLHVHHIIPWAGHPKLRFDDSNAVTLCRRCHYWTHSKANVNGDWKGVSWYGVANLPRGC